MTTDLARWRVRGSIYLANSQFWHMIVQTRPCHGNPPKWTGAARQTTADSGTARRLVSCEGFSLTCYTHEGGVLTRRLPSHTLKPQSVPSVLCQLTLVQGQVCCAWQILQLVVHSSKRDRLSCMTFFTLFGHDSSGRTPFGPCVLQVSR